VPTNSLGLAIPTLKVATKQSFNPAPKKVSAWIGQLPMTNIGATAREVFSAITEMNRLQMPPITRIKAIEVLRPTVRYIVNNLEKHYIGVPFPLSEKAGKVAHLCQKLDSEMAITYKIVIEHLLHDKGIKFDKKLMVVAIHRCAIYLGRVIYQCALVYEPTPRNTWKEMHRIYLFSEKHTLHQVPVKDDESEDAQPHALEESYKRLLLLALIDPHHLRQTETQEACKVFEQCAVKTQLVEVTEISKNAQKFFLNLWADGPPSAQLPEGNLQLTRGVDVRGVLQALKSSLDEVSQSKQTLMNSQARKELLTRIIKQLTDSKARSFPRTTANYTFKTTLNLSQTHDYLVTTELLNKPADKKEVVTEKASGKRHPITGDLIGADPFAADPFPDAQEDDWFDQTFKRQSKTPKSVFEDVSLSDLSMLPKDELFGAVASDNLFLQPKKVEAPPKKPVQKPAEVKADKTQKNPLFVCSVLNESSGGYCFAWSGPSPNTKVGELVGVVDEEDPMHLRIGVVRWIKHPPGEALQFGVEMIAPSALHASISQQNKNESKSLLLPEIEMVGEAASLLTGAMQYRPNMVLDVHTDETNMKIKLAEEVESTNAFTRFHFVILESDANTPKEDVDSHALDEPDDDLDSLWSML